LTSSTWPWTENLKGLDPRVREEYDFVRIAANSLNADAKTIASWEQQLLQFLQKNARSHRFYEGSVILGDVRARMGKFAEAAEAYRNLDRGPPALQIRSASARASLLMSQGKFADAIKEFQAAEKIITSDDDTASVRQKLEASLGRARCLSRSGKAAEGAAVAKDVIVATQPDEKDLLADAYTVLGTCERAAGGRDQDAIVAFLTVDLVYSGVPSAHAEALYNLVSLWDASNQPERSRQAAQVLMTSYPNSPWAAKLPGAGKSS
jgi:tetratricopeptide (TPR) repeat protein